MKKNIQISAALFFLISGTVISQTCFTGGTGIDGAYSAASNTSIAGGTYNFTTFNINTGVSVNVTGTQPLIINCTGNVTIDGALIANGGNGQDGLTYVSAGVGGIGVAGGANGANGTFSSGSGPIPSLAGSGPGGVGTQADGWSGGGGAGYAVIGGSTGSGFGGNGGPVYGNANISGFESGSGGGGGSGGYDCGAGGGGAGGGVIIINGATSINVGVGGMISANGGNGGSDGTGNCGGGGGGSGGAIILASPSIVNDGSIYCLGGAGGGSNIPGSPYYGVGGVGSVGRIRIDHNGSITGSGVFTPAIGSEFPIESPPTITVNAVPNDSICNGDQVTLSGVGANTYIWSSGVIDGAAFTPMGTLTYTVTGTSLSGCTNTTTISIEVLPLPSVGFLVTPNDSICEGSSLTLAGSGATFYTWSGSVSDNISFIPLSSSVYTVTGTDAFGCSNTASVGITINPNPNVNLGADVVQPNPPVILDAGSGFSTYLWNDSSITQTNSVSTNGTYIVTVTNANGCSDSDTIQVTFTAGINSANDKQEIIQLYPNPSNGILNLHLQNMDLSTYNLSIIDLAGRIVYLQYNILHVNNVDKLVDVNHLKSGVYILQINANDKSHSQRFIINR